jgi:hypothetical protein
MISHLRNCILSKSSFINILAISILIIYLNGCNSVIEPDPVELPEVPEKVVNMFNRRYPDATETTMRVVEKGNFWEADFKLGNERFYAGMDSVEILRRLRLETSEVPDSIRNLLVNTTLSNVELTGYKEEVESFAYPDKYFVAKYTYQNKDYQMMWGGGMKSYALTSIPYYKFFGRMYPNYIPENILAFMAAENLRSLGGALFINEKNERTYRMNAQHTGDNVYDFIFDSKGTLLWTSFNRKDITNTLNLPAHIQAYLQQMETQYGYKFAQGYEVYRTGGYSLFLQKGIQESLNVKLDKDANELDRDHMIYVNW